MTEILLTEPLDPNSVQQFYHKIVWYVYSLELPQGGDSNEYIQHTIIPTRSSNILL